MTTDHKLESYLARLDKALKQMSTSDRADIITEIKSHVMMALEKDPAQNMGSVLASLGEPEAVASKYLMERGFKPHKPSATPIVKWLVIGFLGTFGITTLFAAFIIANFSPLIEVNEQKGEVRILGGLIDVKDLDDKDHVGIEFGETKTEIEGSESIVAKELNKMKVNFTNGKFEITSTDEPKISWKCKIHGKKEAVKVGKSGKDFVMDMSAISGAKCNVEIPQDLVSEVFGNNGKIEIYEPASGIDIKLNNGKIGIFPNPAKAYKYNLDVKNGKIDAFESSENADAIIIKAEVGNGKIDRIE